MVHRKVTPSMVRRIKRQYAGGASMRQLALKHDVSLATIHKAIHDKIIFSNSWHRGESHPMGKLTMGQVREIRQLYSTGNYTLEELGQQFGITGSNVGYIVKKRTWDYE